METNDSGQRYGYPPFYNSLQEYRMSDTTLEEKVDNLLIEVSEIKTALKGYNGGTGLLKTFEQHCNQDREFRRDYFSFKRKVIAIFFFVLGSGGLGFGVVKLVEMAR